MANDLTIKREAGMWVAHLEKPYPLIPDHKSLYLLVKAIESTYPEYTVWIDPRISENPFLSNKLKANNLYKLAPDYKRVQSTLDHPESKVCGICGGVSWYNCFSNYYWHVGWWECTNPKCQAHEHEDGSWFKMSRNAR